MSEPADLFANLYARLAERADEVLLTADPDHGLMSECEKRFTAWLRNPRQMEASLIEWVGNDVNLALLLCQQIDGWFAVLADPGSDLTQHDKRYSEALSYYRQHHRLNRMNVDWPVILRRPLSGRWSESSNQVPEAEGLAQFFENLFVLPRSIHSTHPDDRNVASNCMLSFRLSTDQDCRSLPVISPWKIGLVPLATEPDDLVIATHNDKDGDWYDIDAGSLETRLDSEVQSLLQDGCHILAFPEMVLTPASEEHLKRVIRKYGPASDLCLVLAGSSRVEPANTTSRPRNRCTVFDHRGRIILQQHKMARWNLTEDLCDRYGVQRPEKGQIRREHIEPGTELRVVERHGLGRLGVLICEDLGRSEPGQWLRQHMLLDLQFTPVLDSDLRSSDCSLRWATAAGRDASLLGGCRVIVANSMVLTHLQNDTNRIARKDSWIKTECGVGILLDRSSAVVRGRIVVQPLHGAAKASTIVEWKPSTWETLPQ